MKLKILMSKKVFQWRLTKKVETSPSVITTSTKTPGSTSSNESSTESEESNDSDIEQQTNLKKLCNRLQKTKKTIK
jgi:hypothetical protein